MAPTAKADSIALVCTDDALARAACAALGVEARRVNRPEAKEPAIGAVASDADAIRFLVKQPQVECVIARASEFKAGELAALATSVARRRGANVEDFLAPGAETHFEMLQSYAERDGALERLQTFLGNAGFADFPALAQSLVLEMLMNAFLDAPKQAGASRLSEEKQVVKIGYGMDGKRLAISVQDPYGTITRDKVVESLDRSHRQGAGQIRTGPGGAGIGLYMMYASVSQMQIVVAPGIYTRVLLVMRVAKRYSEFTEAGKAFHFLVEA